MYRFDTSERYIVTCHAAGDSWLLPGLRRCGAQPGSAALALARQRGIVLEDRDFVDTPEHHIEPGQLYDTIGATYTVTRRTEPRIAARIWAALGDARTVLNVGAGTGSYEPSGREVTAVEPSAVMRAKRPASAAPCVDAAAESLPFEDQSFDAAMAIATVHHWHDPIAGLREMRRVARRVVVFTHDTTDAGWSGRFWLTRDYLPEVADFLVGRPSLTELASAIGARTEPVLIPWDCADGFFEAYWRRPEAYLDDHVRRGISGFARVGPEAEQRAVRSLRDDLVSGRWAERNRDLVALDAAELGLRLLIA
jgi:SAM-dependent methyltransferase